MTRRDPPSYEQIADAIETVLDAALIELHPTRLGQDITVYQVARCLDKAGLIDWKGVPT